MRIQLFKIKIPIKKITDLKLRLKNTRWPDSIEGSGWEYGTDLDYMKELTRYWRVEFDWRAQENALNKFHHYLADIDGFRIHFIHEKSKNKNAIPIVITHGWPGSFFEMKKIIPLLTDEFHIVVPSIPGFGFSSRPTKRGCNTFKIAELWMKLMAGLGYDKFVAQGGDFGAYVSTLLGFLYPKKVIGVHLNYIPGAYYPYIGPEVRPISEIESQFLNQADEWYKKEGGYAFIQRTKPQTLGFALNDSPAGLAAWIAEKFRAWSDCGGEVERRFTKDELLTNISIYWFTETIHSSARLYFESARAPLQFKQTDRMTVPVGIAHFPKEIFFPPKEWIERFYPVSRWTDLPHGGHFAAMEDPELLAKDVREFVGGLKKG